MKKWAYHIVTKSFCVILAVISLFSAVVSGLGIAFLLQANGYRFSYEKIKDNYLIDRYCSLSYSIADRYHLYSTQNWEFHEWLEALEWDENFSCTIFRGESNLLHSDYKGEEYETAFTERIFVSNPAYEDVGYHIEKGSTYDVTLYISTPKQGSNLETQLAFLKFCWNLRYGLIAIFASTLVLFLLLCVFLVIAAGKKGEQSPKIKFLDRIYFESYLLFFLILGTLQIEVLENISYVLWLSLVIASAFFIIDTFLFLFAIITLAVRMKTKTLAQTTLVGKFIRVLKNGKRFSTRIWEDIRLEPKVAIALAAVALLDLFLATVLDFTECLAAFLIEGIVLSAVLIWYAASLQRLQNDLSYLAEGDLEHRSDLDRLPPGLRSFGEKLNQTAEGMEKAVEEKMKSERFKTELITNVSHDIKTPLTSIVNFVDLMKKEKIKNEKVKEYLEVLDRQSLRLKKLTEDLVESSKAASGVISVSLEQCDAKLLLEQAMAEYQIAFEEKHLSLCMQIPKESVLILADGKRLWRVLDNLFCNIVKYSLENTRVYITLEEKEDRVQMIFRNISAMPISATAEELSERFVRGDASRNTEGSGLGLSIARSLTELQKGTLEIFVDGDLFKVVLILERYQ